MLIGAADYATYGKPDVIRAAVQRFGLTCFRCDLYWRPGMKAVTDEQWRWIDGINQALRVPVVWTLTPEHGREAPIDDESRWQFSSWAASVAHVTMSSLLEVFNEPNEPLFWSPVDARAWAVALAGAYSAIHDVRPRATVIGGSIAQGQHPFEFLQAAGKIRVDAVSLHGYRLGVAWARKARAELWKAAGSKPVWVTEDGYKPGDTRGLRAGLAAAEAIGARGWINLQVCNSSEPQWSDWKSGLLEEDGSVTKLGRVVLERTRPHRDFV